MRVSEKRLEFLFVLQYSSVGDDLYKITKVASEVDKEVSGFLYLVLDVIMIGILIDLIVIVSGFYQDSNGRVIKDH